MRKELWVKPPIAPITAEEWILKVRIILVENALRNTAIKAKGANFWIIKRINREGQDNPSTSEGIHWWKGAAALLSSRAAMIR